MGMLRYMVGRLINGASGHGTRYLPAFGVIFAISGPVFRTFITNLFEASRVSPLHLKPLYGRVEPSNQCLLVSVLSQMSTDAK